MSNSIVRKSDPKVPRVRMSNSVTDVVIALLVMSASEKAKRLSEIEHSVSLATRDQSIFGRGCIGFDIRRLPWARESTEFDKDKEFLLQIISCASKGCYSNRLDYKPGLKFISRSFKELSLLFAELEYTDTNDQAIERIQIPKPPYRKCELHGCYLHKEGCVICNNI